MGAAGLRRVVVIAPAAFLVSSVPAAAIGDITGHGRNDLVLADFPHRLVALLNAGAARSCVVPDVIGLLLAKTRAKIKKPAVVLKVKFRPQANRKRNRVLRTTEKGDAAHNRRAGRSRRGRSGRH
jgi:hypothetical protein